MAALMRLLLASSGLLVIYIDPSEPDRYVVLTYALLVLYSLYSAAIYLLTLYRDVVLEGFRRWAHWADVAWYAVLIALSNGTNSVFFFSFFYAILVASFRRGFAAGMAVAITSAFIFTTIGLLFTPTGTEFELNRFLLRPTYLLVLGYMIAQRGGFEIGLRRRLLLLKEMAHLSNPRFGIDRTLGSMLEQVRAFYAAEVCLLIMAERGSAEYALRRTTRRNPAGGANAEMIPEHLARQLLALPPAQAVIYYHADHRWQIRYYAYDVRTGKNVEASQATAEDLAAQLDAQAFITVPVLYYGEFNGRLFLTARHAFKPGDIDFLLQVIGHFMPMLDNVRLVDQLASHAAEAERQRIARDIHDGIIQPYLGLQIGLAALRRQAGEERGNLTKALDDLLELTNAGVHDLRSYVSTLKDGGADKDNFLSLIKRFTAKFAAATGIAIQVDAPTEINVNDRLAAELFQMINEGLSNIRRHTPSRWAKVRLSSAANRLTLAIENEGGEDASLVPFTPTSIAGRAQALGGQVAVIQNEAGNTVVIIVIPL